MLRSWGGLTRHVTWAVSYPSGLQLPHLQRGGGGTALMLPSSASAWGHPQWGPCLPRMPPASMEALSGPDGAGVLISSPSHGTMPEEATGPRTASPACPGPC